MSGERYRDLCVRDIVVFYAENVRGDFILIDDNTRPHRPRIVAEFLGDHNIERMYWPLLSPDMNPIEHVWSKMKIILREWQGQRNSVDDLVSKCSCNLVPQPADLNSCQA
ncbi:hypothetical protein YQE_04156, partial [Dendroctonus ponderosae]